MGDNSDSHQLLSVVAAIHHERVGETLDDWALCLSEPLLCVSAGRVGDVDRSSDLDVIALLNMLAQNLDSTAYQMPLNPSNCIHTPSKVL